MISEVSLFTHKAVTLSKCDDRTDFLLSPSDETPAEDIERAMREAEVAQTLTDVVHMILPG